jgi:hypothetical protein
MYNFITLFIHHIKFMFNHSYNLISAQSSLGLSIRIAMPLKRGKMFKVQQSKTEKKNNRGKSKWKVKRFFYVLRKDQSTRKVKYVDKSILK